MVIWFDLLQEMDFRKLEESEIMNKMQIKLPRNWKAILSQPTVTTKEDFLEMVRHCTNKLGNMGNRVYEVNERKEARKYKSRRQEKQEDTISYEQRSDEKPPNTYYLNT